MAAVTVGRLLQAIGLLALLGGCAHRVDPPAASTPDHHAATQQPEAAAATASPTEPGTTGYRCEGGVAFTVRDDGDFVLLHGLPRGDERLGRDAGGVTPGQTVYSSATLRAEFGLGTDGRDAVLHDLQSAVDRRCRRE